METVLLDGTTHVGGQAQRQFTFIRMETFIAFLQSGRESLRLNHALQGTPTSRDSEAPVPRLRDCNRRVSRAGSPAVPDWVVRHQRNYVTAFSNSTVPQRQY